MATTWLNLLRDDCHFSFSFSFKKNKIITSSWYVWMITTLATKQKFLKTTTLVTASPQFE
jgi:hypothetical protein